MDWPVICMYIVYCCFTCYDTCTCIYKYYVPIYQQTLVLVLIRSTIFRLLLKTQPGSTIFCDAETEEICNSR